MHEERKKNVIYELNLKLGTDLKDLDKIYEIRSELLSKKDELEKSLSLANCEVPSKVSAAISRAEAASDKIKDYREKATVMCKQNEEFINKLEPVTEKLRNLVDQIRHLEATKGYLDTIQDIDSVCADLKTTTDSEQSIILLQQLYDFRKQYNAGHRGVYISDTAHYWYNILKDKFSKEFEECLKALQWPFTSSTISLSTTVPPEALVKFKQLSQFLLQIQLPSTVTETSSAVTQEEQEPCLPVRLMIKPLKKRFAFHFSGSRKTNRLDRPEWFMTQILSWLRDHLPFISKQLQPVVDGLEMDIDVEHEFTCGMLRLVVDRLHVLLSTIISDDVLFSHAVDECLGFERELRTLVGEIPLSDKHVCPKVTAVLTDARYLQRWLAVEKKFAIQKIDEMLSGEEWLQVLGATEGTAAQAEGIPQGADWLISLLHTVHDRYSVLPQPGHRLQFLELQIELCEELRVRLIQLIGEELHHSGAGGGEGGRGLEGSAPRLLTLLNVVHHLRKALIDWSHSVPYLQLHYYKRQFNYFTELQHMPIPDLDTTPKPSSSIEPSLSRSRGGSISLMQVEMEAKQLAQQEVEHLQHETLPSEIVAGDPKNELMFKEESDPDAGVFEEIPGLLERLIDGTCTLICDDLVLEVKAASRDYRNQKWHCLAEASDWRCRTLSGALCGALGALGSRLLKLHSSLTPQLFHPLTRAVAREIDTFIFEEVVVECLWGPGGAQQFQFDMTRNLMPIFAQYTSSPEAYLPKIKESCTLLLLLRGSAILLQEVLSEATLGGAGDITTGDNNAHRALAELSIRHLSIEDTLRVLKKRTDLTLNL